MTTGKTIAFILSYKIAIFSRDKIKTYKLSRKHEIIHMKERVVNNHFYHMAHKKEDSTYHRIEKLMKEMPGFLSPGRGLPLLLILEYSPLWTALALVQWKRASSSVVGNLRVTFLF